MTESWRDTQLYKTLKSEESLKPELKELIRSLDKGLGIIQTWLNEEPAGEIIVDQFTLHDPERAFRVAERMGEIISLPSLSEEKLLDLSDDYELALLLLSAYLLDICLTPKYGKLSQLHHYLLTGNEPPQLAKEEISKFEEWLNNEGFEVPLSEGTHDEKTKREADKLITYYCRERHKDWSENWIEANLSKCSLYNDSVANDWSKQDLIQLCLSPFQTYQELSKIKLKPKSRGKVGGKPIEIRRGYLVAVVRAANILEFDPMRIPDVILQNSSIQSSQLINWWDTNYHETYLTIKDKQQVKLEIRPTNALVHRAIITIGDEIDRVLTECQKLAFNNNFADVWFLQPSISRDIEPKEDTYEYIDGAFRPNTQKILELLSGIELYGNPLVAVRELLQNAFDAVREEIAYKRLRGEEHKLLPNSHYVNLEVQQNEEGAWLVCTDNGVGMTKAIIQNYLLVSGSARRHQIIDLERQCKAKGFSLGRTGQFGIGVLSYFMLTDRIIIKTQRSREPGDDDTKVGWQFETEGIGTFGELRECRLKHDTQGTELRLHLKPEVYGEELSKWFSELRVYLKKLLVYLPCKFKVKSDNCLDSPKLELEPGWIPRKDNFSELVIESLKPSFNDSFSSYQNDDDIFDRQEKEQIKKSEREKEKRNRSQEGENLVISEAWKRSHY